MLAALVVTGARADQQAVEIEYKLKAACLFNFTKFVEWPPKAFTSDTVALVIAVLGANPFGDVLDQAVAGRTVNGRPITVRYASRAEELADAHLVFVSRAAQAEQAGALRALAARGVLTVGEGDGFLRAGGMVQFLVADKKLRFAIAEPVAQQAGLRLSAQLLALAVPAREAG